MTILWLSNVWYLKTGLNELQNPKAKMLQLQNFHALPVPLQTPVQTTTKLNLPNYEIKPIRRLLPMNVVNCLYIF